MLVLIPASSIAATTHAPSFAPLNSVPGPSGSFSSAFTIQNLSANIAICTYTFYDSLGSAAYESAQFQIPVGGSNFTYVPNISGLAIGQYSGVVTCDQPVSAVVNTASTNSGGSYGGISNTSATWYAPNAFNNYYGFNTNFVVQNASSSPVNVTIDIINASGSVVATQSQNNLPAYAYVNFDQAGLSGLSSNVAYSAKITGTGTLAVESNIYGQGAYTNELFSYTPFIGGSLTTYAPVIMNNYYGYSTALTVQNLGTSAANVTVTYGTGATQTAVIAASSSSVFYTPSSGLAVGTLTSATITSDQNIVALVNETNNYLRAASYTAFASGSTSVSVPIVLKRYYNFNTSITCQNIGTTATNMTITYSNAATSTQNAIAANGIALFYQPNEAGLSNGFNGSAKVTSSSQPIVCIVNEDQNEGSQATTSFDQLFSYEGMAVP
jgi:hypothetical protein